MAFEDTFFVRRKPSQTQLIAYGFVPAPVGFIYRTNILNGQFSLEVQVLPDGSVHTHLTDSRTQAEYTLYKIENSAGAYVGKVRTACAAVLKEIAKHCFEPDIFRQEQTLQLLAHVREKYGTEPEFLWKQFPDYAVLRRADNQKWYAIIMTLPQNKLGLPSKEPIEVVDLRISPSEMNSTLDHRRYFPGWHMNKKTWYTALLDNAIPTSELLRRAEESYLLAGK